MELTDIKTIKYLAQRFNFSFKKGFGQNFLTDSSILDCIVSAAEIADGVLEIGPGFGVLTNALAQTKKKVIAVEVDEKEVAIREALPGNNCGGCGYPGCDGLAAAIAKGEAPVNRCPVGGEPVGKIIAGIIGQEAVETARQVAHVQCSGTCSKAE